ncbi:MAG: FAD-dependent oxidoreductase, partial [Saprospiraceae bacterium]|nr:FAD-dependent oxidoreductase [Saprospiraceae bacterium]
AYTYRLCVSKDPDNKIPFLKPAGYDENEFELLFRIFEAGDERLPLKIEPLPNNKYDINSLHSFSTDGAMLNWRFPTGDYATRAQIIERQTKYEQGIIWTLANHPRVPRAIRDEVSQYGLAKDEFIRNGGWPYEIYIREARRMVSDYVMTQHHAEGSIEVNDPVAEASFGMDSHVVQMFINEEGHVHREGVIWRVPPRPYGISYRSIVPKIGETENLFVPVCLSASHVAHGSIRMEPQFMMLGQAAALAAVMGIHEQVAVQHINYEQLAELIKEHNEGFVF